MKKFKTGDYGRVNTNKLEIKEGSIGKILDTDKNGCTIEFSFGSVILSEIWLDNITEGLIAVEFMDAIRAINQGKRIYVIYPGCCNCNIEDFIGCSDKDDWIGDDDTGISPNMILNGTWFIKE